MKISNAQKTVFAVAGVALLVGVVSVVGLSLKRSADRRKRLRQAIEDAEARARMDSEGGSLLPVDIH